MNKRVLVIDDDNSILEVITEILGYSQFDVKALSDANMIFQTISQFNPNLILIDYFLSGVNGGEFCHQIKTNHSTAHIPVIIMSAYPRTFLSLGSYNCDMFIPKPFEMDDLINKIVVCVNRKYKIA
jgi:DNA-binding response OmpR family regulator